MKHLKIVFLLITALAFSLNANAQRQSDEDVNATLGYGDQSSYVYQVLTDADTIGVNDSVWTYVIRDKSQKRLMYSATVTLDSISDSRDTSTVDVELWDKTSAAQSYTKRQSATWVNGSDTTITLTTASFRISEFAKLRVIGEFDEFNAKVSYLFIKSVEE